MRIVSKGRCRYEMVLIYQPPNADFVDFASLGQVSLDITEKCVFRYRTKRMKNWIMVESNLVPDPCSFRVLDCSTNVSGTQ
jgi:hypothetical protein